MTGPRFLDWRTHTVGTHLPCRICGNPAMCRDEHGRPCHKICAEQTPTDTTDAVALVVDLDTYRTNRPTQRPRRTA